MNKEQKPKGKFMSLVTKNYWISAVVCLFLGAWMAQTVSLTPGSEQSLTGMLAVDVPNILAVVFIAAGIGRVIRNRKNTK